MVSKDNVAHIAASGADPGRRPRLALHESCERLRGLYPHCPQVYDVAVLAEVNKRRWHPLDSTRTVERLRAGFDETAAVADRRAAAQLLAARLTHEVLGRALPLLLLDGRVWDVGLENLWVHFDGDNDIDWLAVVDPTVRVLPGDPWAGEDRAGVRVLPCEAALTTWVAHRCHRTLAPLFVWLHAASRTDLPIAAMWQIVGSAVVAAAAALPCQSGRGEAVGCRRAQAVLDALVGFGLPVRGTGSGGCAASRLRHGSAAARGNRTPPGRTSPYIARL